MAVYNVAHKRTFFKKFRSYLVPSWIAFHFQETKEGEENKSSKKQETQKFGKFGKKGKRVIPPCRTCGRPGIAFKWTKFSSYFTYRNLVSWMHLHFKLRKNWDTLLCTIALCKHKCVMDVHNAAFKYHFRWFALLNYY